MAVVHIETDERLTQTFRAHPLVLRRSRRSDSGAVGGTPTDKTVVMLTDVQVFRSQAWPEATAPVLRRMAAACNAAADAMEGD